MDMREPVASPIMEVLQTTEGNIYMSVDIYIKIYN